MSKRQSQRKTITHPDDLVRGVRYSLRATSPEGKSVRLTGTFHAMRVARCDCLACLSLRPDGKGVLWLDLVNGMGSYIHVPWKVTSKWREVQCQ